MQAHHKQGRRERQKGDPSQAVPATHAVLTFASAGAAGFTLNSNEPLILDAARNSDPSGNLPGLTAGTLTIGSVTLASPTQAVFHTNANATLAGTLTISEGFKALRTASGGFVAPGTFHG